MPESGWLEHEIARPEGERRSLLLVDQLRLTRQAVDQLEPHPVVVDAIVDRAARCRADVAGDPSAAEPRWKQVAVEQAGATRRGTGSRRSGCGRRPGPAAGRRSVSRRGHLDDHAVRARHAGLAPASPPAGMTSSIAPRCVRGRASGAARDPSSRPRTDHRRERSPRGGTRAPPGTRWSRRVTPREPALLRAARRVHGSRCSAPRGMRGASVSMKASSSGLAPAPAGWPQSDGIGASVDLLDPPALLPRVPHREVEVGLRGHVEHRARRWTGAPSRCFRRTPAWFPRRGLLPGAHLQDEVVGVAPGEELLGRASVNCSRVMLAAARDRSSSTARASTTPGKRARRATPRRWSRCRARAARCSRLP